MSADHKPTSLPAGAAFTHGTVYEVEVERTIKATYRVVTFSEAMAEATALARETGIDAGAMTNLVHWTSRVETIDTDVRTVDEEG